MPSHKKTIALLLALALAAVAMVGVRAQRGQEQRIKDLERELRAMAARQHQSQEVESPPPAIAAWAKEKTTAPPTMVAPAQSAEAMPLAAAESPQPPTAAAGIPDDEYAANVAAAFTEERRDTAWANDAERAISTSLRGISDTGLLENVECRENLCKASLRHRDQNGFTAFLDGLLARANETWTGEIFSYREPGEADNGVDNTLYFAKPGRSIHALALPQ